MAQCTTGPDQVQGAKARVAPNTDAFAYAELGNLSEHLRSGGATRLGLLLSTTTDGVRPMDSRLRGDDKVIWRFWDYQFCAKSTCRC